MFPFDVDIEDEEEVIEDENNLNTDYEIDFNTGRLTGRIITGLAAVVQWARLTLATERYFYTQYSWDYGSELQSLIGRNHSKDYIESEVKRILNEALLVNEDIKSIEDLRCDIEGDKLSISFGLETVYGRGDIDV
nr:MAG TPA: Protein of unknown function (DUF2634) [Caudoviricetes sp.]